MTLSKKLEELINQQIQHEFENSRLYLAMSQYLNYNSYYGAAKLYKKHSNEEAGHADKFLEYLQDRNVLPQILPLPNPGYDMKGLVDITEKTLDREVETTKNISHIKEVALQEKDYLTAEFLHGLLTEQIEEEAQALYWKDRVEAFGDSKSGLLLIDQEMGKEG